MDTYFLSRMWHSTLTNFSWKRVCVLVKKRDRCTCQYCGRFDAHGQVDHVLPLSRGGSDSIHNLVWACQNCNGSKGDRTVREWISGLARIENNRVLRMINDFQAMFATHGEPSSIMELQEEYNDAILHMEAALQAAAIVKEGWLKSGIPQQLIDEYILRLDILIGLRDVVPIAESGDDRFEISPGLLKALKKDREEGYPFLEKTWSAHNGENGHQLKLFE